MAFDMAKFLGRFVDEAREHVGKLNEGLVHLEKDPDDSETINSIFRSAHTIKGSSRMMKLNQITEVAHKLEDALGALREKKFKHSKELADLLFRGIDAISDMIDKTAAGQEITVDNSSLCEDLARAAEGNIVQATAPASPPTPPSSKGEDMAVPPLEPEAVADKTPNVSEAPAPVQPGPSQPQAAVKETKETKLKAAETVRINSEKLDELIKLMGEIVSNQNRLKQRLFDVKEIEAMANRSMKLFAGFENGEPQENKDEVIGSARALFLKIKQLVSSVKDDTNIHELLTGELQEKALRMRMVPLSLVFDSLHRMVRDISRSIGKEVDLVIEGGDIELDKKMIDKIGDPLVHMLRNSVDHGVETPQERQKAGKPATGVVKLSACYDAGSVLIELSDDGGGIPLEKIREKALRKKMFSESEIADMSETALIDLIFHPGFSTSAIITDVSGRGVGMDVVKRNIVEDLRGSIRIESKEGKGTSFYIRLPMTLAVMRILLVRVMDSMFAITAHNVSEIVRFPKSELINVVDKKAVRLRNEFIPVINLEALLKLNGRKQVERDDLLIIIIYMGSEKMGLIVDELLDEEDMVIKSLPSHMKNINLVSGVTISGKNEIINVLHIPSIIEAAKEMRESRIREETKEDLGAVNILVVDDSINTREIEKSILEAYGYKVDLAGDGMEGLEKAKAFKYDLVITDVEMPRMDGFSLTERLRNDEAYKDTPIVIVTSREKEEDKRRGIMVGADAYIVKGSFDQSSLLEIVQNLVG